MHEMTKISLTLASLLVLVGQSLAGVAFSAGLESDLSRPTFGLQGQSESSMSYDDRNGLNMRGVIADILGPPIKIANGFNQMLTGNNMAGLGSTLQNNGAVLNVDSQLLEGAGDASLLKGGLLLGGSAAKVGAAKVLAGTPGKKIASIIELPVKVVALKDIAAGKALRAAAEQSQGGQQIEQSQVKGSEGMRQGESSATKGMNQVIQGATEGVHNIENMIQKTAGNAAAAFRLLPIVLDSQVSPEGQQQQQQVSPSSGNVRHGLGSSLFGGLSALMPGSQNSNPLMAQNGLAAVLNATNPLTNLFLNPAVNPFLLPLSTSNNPIAQGLTNKQPIGLAGASSVGQPQQAHGLFGNSNSLSYNIFPGVRVKETSSSRF